MAKKLKKKINEAASALAKMRWSKIKPEDRNQYMPTNRGRKRLHPKCKRYKNKAHRFTNDRCPCGYVRNSLKT